jgi:hypothetical protein
MMGRPQKPGNKQHYSKIPRRKKREKRRKEERIMRPYNLGSGAKGVVR